MIRDIGASLFLLGLFVLVTGIGYPWAMTGIALHVFPDQAQGSLLYKGDRLIGSALIGQTFTKDIYFHGRPSAAGDGYAADNSSGSNLAPTSSDLLKTISERVSELRSAEDNRAIPIDLVTASGSGLDPDISIASANFEAPRIAAARGIALTTVLDVVAQTTQKPILGVIGEPKVNVLALNLALDALGTSTP